MALNAEAMARRSITTQFGALTVLEKAGQIVGLDWTRVMHDDDSEFGEEGEDDEEETQVPGFLRSLLEQLGGTCVFLCSDAAAQITGTTISVDGGWTAL